MTTNATVLLVDDDKDILETVDRILYHYGIRAITANNVFEAMSKFIANENIIDLIITDIHMPDGSGKDLISWIKSITTTPVLALTACEEEVNATKMMKPFNIDDFIILVKRMIIDNVVRQEEQVALF